MADIYGNEIEKKPGNFLQFNDVIITIAGATDSATALLQGVSFTFAQNVGLIREIGSDFFYFAKAKSQGQMQVDRLVSTSKSFETLFGKMCRVKPGDAESLAITVKSKKDGINWGYKIVGPMVANMGIQVSADGGYVRENVMIAFSSLEKIR